MKKQLSIFTLTMINVAAICNIKNFPLSALYGLPVIFFYALAALVYFIPISFVAAELASTWSERGIYQWVKEAMGPRMGFIAIWLQWIENIIWYPSILSFIAATIAYMFNPELANDKIYILTVIILSFWTITFLNFFGMKVSGFISNIAALFGTILPGALIIILGLAWVIGGNPSQTSLNSGSFFPDLTSINQLVIFAGILLALSGMEMSAVHAKEVENPKQGYPKAILLSAIIILVLSSLGSLAVAIVVPIDKINLASGSMEAFSVFFNNYQVGFLIPVMAFVMAIGALGMISTWVVGPSKGIYAAALDGDLPPLLQKSNSRNMPIALLILQAIFVTGLSLVFLLMPNVSASYWILINLTVQLYLIMYVLMFLSAVILRYKKPDIQRPYKAPYLRLIATVGILASSFVFFIGFIPPGQIQTGSVLYYELVLIGGMVLFLLIPYIIYDFKKDSWKQMVDKDQR